MVFSAIEIILLLLFFTTLGASFASRFQLPTEAVLLLGSLSISLIPSLPRVQLVPEIVFLVFLPPILFAAAFFTDWREFKFNLRPISLLSIGLVLFTTVFVAVVLKYLIPEMGWAPAFALGAIVSPSDASAATAIVKKLGIPHRLSSIVEGESLVNDATALVCYRFAVRAIFTGSFSFTEALGRLIWVASGGAIVGTAIGLAGIWIQQKMKESKAETVLSFLTAYGCYIVGEHLDVSGVISTVVGGLVFGKWQPKLASTSTRVLSRATWQIALFIINGLVFTLIGLQLQSVLGGLREEDYSTLDLAKYALVIGFVVIALRLFWVFPESYLPRWLSASLRKRDPTPSWKQLVILGWTGMRGIVSLAAALSLPEHLPSGEIFEYRNLLIFLTYSVILITLLLPALTLPLLIRSMGVAIEKEDFKEEALARMALTRRSIECIRELQSLNLFSRSLLEQFLTRLEHRVRSSSSHLRDEPFSELIQEEHEIRRLTRITLAAERAALLDLRLKGTVHEEVFHRLSEELDLEELRLKSARVP
ncbi:MAG: Na+/H+ antiporter [Bdellovibrionia bacterium]